MLMALVGNFLQSIRMCKTYVFEVSIEELHKIVGVEPHRFFLELGIGIIGTGSVWLEILETGL